MKLTAATLGQALKAAHKRSKYGSVAFTDADGVRWHSRSEAKRYGELRLLERAGKISELRRQVALPLHALGGGLVGKLVVDFAYAENGEQIYEDHKGVTTPLAAWKLRHAEREYGIEIRIHR